jgi:hypothetical protein
MLRVAGMIRGDAAATGKGFFFAISIFLHEDEERRALPRFLLLLSH